MSATQLDLRAVGPESIITFPNGLIGQPDWNRFVLLTVEEDDTVGVLQSVDNEALSIMVTDPFLVAPEYAIELTDEDRSTIGLEADQQPVVMTTLSVHGELITTNLMGPLIVNPRTRAATQVVLGDVRYTTRHPISTVAPAEMV
jgi:flagellar assembly factor FliW